MISNELFEKKWSPSDISKFAMLDRIKRVIPENTITKNLLFYGGSGRGKSSILKTISGNNCFYVNASVGTGVSLLKEDGELYDFCSQHSFESGQKVVFLDEVDGASEAFFKGVKGFMDSFPSVRFVATTNFITEIPDNVKSRFELVDFDFASQDEEKEFFIKYRNRLFAICKAEGITVSKESIEGFSRMNFPDFRKGLQSLQTLCENGIREITEDTIKKGVYQYGEIYNSVFTLTSKKSAELHALATAVKNPSHLIREFDKDFFDFVQRNYPEKLVKYGDAVIAICRYNEMLSDRIDPMLCLKAMLFTLINILS